MTKKLVGLIESNSCQLESCDAYGHPLLGRSERLQAKFRYGVKKEEPNPVFSLMIGVPKNADLEKYKEFTQVFYPSPTEHFTPEKSFLLLRHMGNISFAKPILSAIWNERGRRTQDRDYIAKNGTNQMGPGHEIWVGAAIPIRKAFPWIDERHRAGLVPGSIYDTNEKDPFEWQMALLRRTEDLRRQSRSPFTVIRTSELMKISPPRSSMVEKRVEAAMTAAGIRLCTHVDSIFLDGKWRQPDITIPKIKTIVEYDGNYWHRGLNNQKRDCLKTQVFINEDWKVIRVREYGLKKLEMKKRGLSQIQVLKQAATAQEIVKLILKKL